MKKSIKLVWNAYNYRSVGQGLRVFIPCHGTLLIFDCRKRAAADADQRGKLRLRDIHPLAQGGQVVGHVADQRCSLPFIH